MSEDMDGWRNLHDRMTANDESHRKYFESSQALIEEQAARIAEAEEDYHEERKARYAAQSELVASQARLSEAVKVLEEQNHGFELLHGRMTWAVNSHPDAKKAQLLRDFADDAYSAISQAKAFITTLGGEK
jgi:hypothetical protein